MGRAPIDQDPVPKRTKEADFDQEWGITIDQQGNPGNLKEAIISGVAITVSDGLFQDSNGSAAWTIEGRNHNHRILGSGRTPEELDDQSAYRSKLFGLWGIFRMIQQFMQECNIQKGHVQIECDGLSALKQAQSWQPINPDAPHYNLIGTIQNIRQAIPIQFSFKHVQGHQDSGITMVLTRTAWMNIEMDTLAKAMLGQNTGPLGTT